MYLSWLSIIARFVTTSKSSISIDFLGFQQLLCSSAVAEEHSVLSRHETRQKDNTFEKRLLRLPERVTRTDCTRSLAQLHAYSRKRNMVALSFSLFSLFAGERCRISPFDSPARARDCANESEANSLCSENVAGRFSFDFLLCSRFI